MKRPLPNAGSVVFDGLTLETSPGAVMTPRASSEQLVARACALIDGSARVADVGTGGGALAIAIAARRPDVVVWATDIDERAVALARANVSRFALDDRVFVRLGDLLEPVPGPLDVIVANLPYLPARFAKDYPELSAEPFSALFSPGDGLDGYRRLVEQTANKLSSTGSLLLQLDEEILDAQRAELRTLSESLRYVARAA